MDDHSLDPSIDLSAFPGTPSEYFWTSSSHTVLPSNAWHVYFYSGYVYYFDKINAFAVRCVRSGL